MEIKKIITTDERYLKTTEGWLDTTTNQFISEEDLETYLVENGVGIAVQRE